MIPELLVVSIGILAYFIGRWHAQIDIEDDIKATGTFRIADNGYTVTKNPTRPTPGT